MSDSHEHKREVCPECGKSVIDVRNHISSVHENVRNFSCPICPLKTYRKGALDRHVAAHDKYSALNKPYPHNPIKHECSLENLGKPLN